MKREIFQSLYIQHQIESSNEVAILLGPFLLSTASSIVCFPVKAKNLVTIATRIFATVMKMEERLSPRVQKSHASVFFCSQSQNLPDIGDDDFMRWI